MRVFILATVWCGVLTRGAVAEDPAIAEAIPKAQEVATKAQKPDDAAFENPMSIFNEEIRRFRFEIENKLVTHEVAVSFMNYYSRSENPDIIGAYADPDTNSLLIVGSPEAETAIRKSLATWVVETAGIGNVSLVAQKRQLLDERKTWLEEMANIEIGLVEATERKGEGAVRELEARLEIFEKELEITERKIEVVNKYMKRMNEVQE